MNTPGKRRGFLPLLFSAMLIVAILVFVPTVTAADPAEFDDFSYQTLSTFDPTEDEQTDLRFLFTVGSLGYDEVGFVFSKTNAAPKLDGDACAAGNTTVVYTAVMANGVPKPASEGRFWVAVKLTGVPRAYYDGTIYVRPYVKVGESVRYGETASLTVRTAAGHVHEWGEWGTVIAPSYLLGDGAERRVCTGCPATEERAVAYGGAAPEVRTFTSDDGGRYENKETLMNIMGDRHFYPTDGNPSGNDLLIEYSLLWNETLLNLDCDEDPFVTGLFAKYNGEEENLLTYWNPTAGIGNSMCPYAGGFEAGDLRTVSPEGAAYTPAGMCDFDGAYSDYPNIGGQDPANPEWGWHRVGVRLHQEVANEAEVRGGADAAYRYVVTTYIDGAPVSMLEGAEFSYEMNYLFTAEYDPEEGIVYRDNTNLSGKNRRAVFAFRFNSTFTLPDAVACWVDADVFYSCGHDFLLPVEKNDAPADATIELDGGVYPAPIRYKLAN